jgi:N-acetylglucosamine repressor
VTTDVLLQACEEGDPTIHALIEEAGYYLGRSVVHMVGALNIHHIFIAGSMSRFGSCLADPIRQQVSRGALPVLAQETQIEISALGTDVVLLGAAALILSRELGIG